MGARPNAFSRPLHQPLYRINYG